MSTDLEKDLAAALRHRADEVSDLPCPPLTAAPAPRRRWIMPVTAAAAVVAGLVAAGVVWLPGSGGGDQDSTVGTAPEVYYSRVVSKGPGPHFVELELWQGKGRTDEWRQDAVGGSTVKDGRVVPDGTVETGGPRRGTASRPRRRRPRSAPRPGPGSTRRWTSSRVRPATPRRSRTSCMTRRSLKSGGGPDPAGASRSEPGRSPRRTSLYWS